MSNVLSALEQSEQGYQQRSQLPTDRLGKPYQTTAQSGYVWLMVLLVPSVVIAIWQAVNTWQHALAQQQLRAAQPAEVIEQPMVYQPLAAVQFGVLKPVPQPEDDVANEPLATEEEPATDSVAKSSVTPAASSQGQLDKQQQNILEGVDLSALPADLALKVHSALSQERESSELSSLERRNWLNLVKNTTQMEGKLPAMNFQTHVYSDNPQKRWVKVNGKEYTSGQMVASGVTLVEIREQGSVLRFAGELIFVPALYDWKG